jgi:hypothetical protein
MCNCRGWCRTFQTPIELEFGPSEHHPDCEDFKLVKFTRVTFDDSYCIMEPAEALAMVADECGDEDGGYMLMDVWMTQDQFERLPEFNGF